MTTPLPDTELLAPASSRSPPAVTAPGRAPGGRSAGSRSAWDPCWSLTLLVLASVAAPLLSARPGGFSAGRAAAARDRALVRHRQRSGATSTPRWCGAARQSLLVAAAASFIAIVVGTAIAVVGAYVPALDGGVGVLVDLTLSLPVLPLMILVAALAGPSTTTIILVIAAFSWPEVTRLVRSQALSVVQPALHRRRPAHDRQARLDHRPPHRAGRHPGHRRLGRAHGLACRALGGRAGLPRSRRPRRSGRGDGSCTRRSSRAPW